MSLAVEPIRIFVVLIGVLVYSTSMIFYLIGKNNIKNFSVGFWTGIVALTLAAPFILAFATQYG